ncbi:MULTISPECIES: hypothetical protein [Rufibacter]|uniref:hypothetical protein n=1 Tax=Rufibacter TaxID=1379908 RepID=UPI001B304E16|nr:MULTISPECIES: hypothetical protein [Rufibacter]
MLKKSYLLTILAAFTLVFSSCSKDDDGDEPKSRVDVSQLEKHEWKVTEHIVKAAGQDDYDVMEEDYGGDIFVKFDGDGEFSVTTESDGDSEFDGSYDVNDDEIDWNFPLSVMAQLNGEDNATYTIEQLNANTFELTTSETMQGVKVTENITFKAQ